MGLTLDNDPFDDLDAAIIALWQLYEAEAAALPPIAPLKDDEPAPRWPPIDRP